MYNYKKYVICVAVALVMGVGAALAYAENNKGERSHEIIADSTSNVESSSSLNESSLNESSLNENSESSKIESESKPESSSNAESSEIEDSSSLNKSSLKENSEMPESRAGDSSSILCNSSEVQKIEQIAVTYTETNSNQTYFEPEIINETQPELGAPIEENTPTIIEDSPTELGEPVTDAVYDPYDLYNQGRLYYGDYQYTWYSERVLPGYGLVIDGRHTDADGFVCDGDGYICVASSSLSKGTVVDTPFGRQGKVYDTGCDWGVIDVYVNW